MKDIFTSYLAQAVTLLANFVGGVLAARLLLPVGRGELGQVMLWPSLFAALGAFSITDAIVYFIASRHADPRWVLASAFGIGGVLSVVLMIAGAVALPYLTAGASSEVRFASYIFLLHIPVGYASVYLVSACAAHRRFDLWNLLRAFISCSYAALALALWLANEATVTAFAVINLCANLVVIVTGTVMLRRLGSFGTRPDAGLMKKMLGYGARLHVGELLTLSNQRLDQILIAQWLLAADFGHYLVAISVYTSAAGLVMLLGSLLFPKVAAAEDDRQRAEALGRYVRLALALAIAGGIVLAILAPWLITLVYGKAYQPTATAVQIFSFGIAPAACKYLLAQAFKAMGRPRTIVLAEFTALAANAIGLVLLIPSFGIFGAAASIVLAQSIACAVLIVAVRRQLGWALRPLFTPTTGDVSFVARRLGDMLGKS